MNTGFNKSAWYSEDHSMFADTISKFYEAEATPNIERWYEQGVVDREFWNKAGAIGLLGSTISEQYGGSGLARSFDAVAVYHYARTGDTSWGFPIQTIVAHYL
ncbi:MAG: acyl-CoA dehydrogenase family protein, partial [Gimesia chilikensis]